jgi:hypothetical protein
MSKTAKAVSINDLPDEIIVKILSFVLDNQRTLSSLRRTCKRFCQLINRNLLTHPNCASYVSNWGECVQCFRIFSLSRFKYAKCNSFVVDYPLQLCCLSTFRSLQPNLGTINELNLVRISFNLVTLSRLLNIMENVHRLRINCPVPMERSETSDCANLSKPFNRTLSYLEINYNCGTAKSDAELILLNFPSRDIRVLNLEHGRKTWFETYLFKHQEVVEYFELLGREQDFEYDYTLQNFLESLHFSNR